MKAVLLSLKVCGFKNIEKPIEIQFANKNIDDSFFTTPKVKAIYGTNGMGKSAIVFAVNTYVKSVLDRNFLAFESTRGDLCDMINKTLNYAFIDLYFAIAIDNLSRIRIFHHTINYQIHEKEVYISSETLSYITGNYWGDVANETVVYETSNNEIKTLYSNITEEFKNQIMENTKNLIGGSSLLLRCIGDGIDYTKSQSDLKFSNAVLCTIIFVASINVFIDEKDSHRMSASKIKALIESYKSINSNSVPERNEFVIDEEIDEIAEKDMKEYEKEIDKICKFLKVFKPNLLRINIDKSPLGNGTYRCKKLLEYQNNVVVDSKYESNGIKKLIKLYPILNNIDDGGVTFIDEFDSNIHDVYLCKLIEYFVLYGNGQLVFTTHNLGPMEVLADIDIKHSIDFINNSQISSWKKNGNYSVVNVYRSGSIPNCPFNIDASDFVRTFGGN